MIRDIGELNLKESKTKRQRTQENSKTNFVLVGNPGVGKSTILNALIGSVQFESGASFGSGLTTSLQRYETKNGIVYIDTPGLSDIDLREKAAKEIEEALKSGGYFKIFFVITLEAGRVKPDDLTTMKLVLDAAPMIGQSYSVIVNKIPPQAVPLLNKPGNREKLESGINHGLPGTNCIYYNEMVTEMDWCAGVLHNLPSLFAQWLLAAPMIAISAEEVGEIKGDSFDQLKKELSSVIEKLSKDNEAMAKALKENSDKMLELQRKNDAMMADLHSEHAQAMQRMMSQHAADLRDVLRDTATIKVPLKEPATAPPEDKPTTPTATTTTSSTLATVGNVLATAAQVGLSFIPGFGPFAAGAGEIIKSFF